MPRRNPSATTERIVVIAGWLRPDAAWCSYRQLQRGHHQLAPLDNVECGRPAGFTGHVLDRAHGPASFTGPTIRHDGHIFDHQPRTREWRVLAGSSKDARGASATTPERRLDRTNGPSLRRDD